MKLEKLLKENTKSSIEYIALDDICDIRGRIGFRGYTRDDQVKKGEGAISLSPSNINNGILEYDNCTYISWYKYNESPEIMVQNNDIIFTKTASVGKVALVKDLPEKATINPQLVVLKEIKCNPSYLYYVLSSKEFQEKVTNIMGLGTIQTISQKKFGKLTVPIPKLDVQNEIVSILDTFTNLDKELNNELELRKKQYEYYRDRLLDFKDDVCYRTLEDLCIIKAGGDIKKEKVSKEKTEEKPIPIISNGVKENAIYGYTDEYKIEAPAITISARGTIGYCELRKENFYPIVRVICLKTKNESINISFLKYYLDTIKFQVNKSGIPQLTIPMIKDIKIPVPDISIQNKIVSILDIFEKLTNDITCGLPKEIEMRKEQYEYYRDKLLKF